ncbi:MAG: type VII toxin-antitoxin system HepT family RNase toxin [Roseiflexus sp.]
MNVEFSGIERRLDELSERLARLAPLRARPKTEFMSDPYLRDIVERNLEVAAQCCIDICHRIITLEGAQKPRSYYEAILRMGELDVLPTDFAERFAPIAGLRNVLIDEYLKAYPKNPAG